MDSSVNSTHHLVGIDCGGLSSRTLDKIITWGTELTTWDRKGLGLGQKDGRGAMSDVRDTARPPLRNGGTTRTGGLQECRYSLIWSSLQGGLLSLASQQQVRSTRPEEDLHSS